MRLTRLSAVAFCLLFAVPVFAGEGVNELGDAFVAAVEAGDLDALAMLYAEDAVSYGPDMMVAKGRTAIVDSWAAFFGQFDISELTLYDAHHETCGDFSTAWGQFRMVATPKGGGDEIVMEGRFADASRKIDGTWQYVMDHASMPIVAP